MDRKLALQKKLEQKAQKKRLREESDPLQDDAADEDTKHAVAKVTEKATKKSLHAKGKDSKAESEDEVEDEQEEDVDEVEDELEDEEDDSASEGENGEDEQNDLLHRSQYSSVPRSSKQKVLVFSSRGITFRHRHLMNDLRSLLPHSKKEAKFDDKQKLFLINELCEMQTCNNCIFFEGRKHEDLYMWVSKVPQGPSVKFLVTNIHSMSELKLTGNCLKGSRPLLSFDRSFDEQPAHQVVKELFIQIFSTPKGHPKSKPFIDHVMSFTIADKKIWVRHYQIQESEDSTKTTEPSLVEIGPRFVLDIVRIFQGSFGGPTLYENPDYVSPNKLRANRRKELRDRFANKVKKSIDRKAREEEYQQEEDELEEMFRK
eukprot:TRINITY_DN2484_c0_g1_i1.p1 TRINITY_DN2484_c0_g1~~TRINITY_DN2484_c0_g1_i1.p1  ORF type:complete len:373 (-),score=119.97 TRINITY_DN2484_c0_g1_i1:30-1148(-)